MKCVSDTVPEPWYAPDEDCEFCGSLMHTDRFGYVCLARLQPDEKIVKIKDHLDAYWKVRQTGPTTFKDSNDPSVLRAASKAIHEIHEILESGVCGERKEFPVQEKA